MREIKFRAWHDEKKIIVSWEEFVGDLSAETTLDWNKSRYTPRDFILVIDAHNKDETALHLMQYTGLKDKNGIEIYEGDVVRRLCPCGNCEESWVGEIVWRDTAAGFVFKDYDNKVDSPIEMYEEEGGNKAVLEVIGNIYENPELLNSKENI